ncbi:hypothetical protein C8R44DRAFT_750940 [Mycena epipterygia]|nr:hypothetical protein C8R44DRAFT_750940 [Mycena epipterygia]
MLFGPSSLSVGGKPAQNSNGLKLGIQNITAMSISTAILARFVLSGQGMGLQGAISGTEWEADYLAYYKLLARNFHLPHMEKIFKKIRAFVFTGVTVLSTSTPHFVDYSDAEDDINDAMRRFKLGTDQKIRMTRRWLVQLHATQPLNQCKSTSSSFVHSWVSKRWWPRQKPKPSKFLLPQQACIPLVVEADVTGCRRTCNNY